MHITNCSNKPVLLNILTKDDSFACWCYMQNTLVYRYNECIGTFKIKVPNKHEHAKVIKMLKGSKPGCVSKLKYSAKHTAAYAYGFT